MLLQTVITKFATQGGTLLRRIPSDLCIKAKLHNFVSYLIGLPINFCNFKILEHRQYTQGFFLQINERRPVKILICKERTDKSTISLQNNGPVKSNTYIKACQASTQLSFIHAVALTQKVPRRYNNFAR